MIAFQTKPLPASLVAGILAAIGILAALLWLGSSLGGTAPIAEQVVGSGPARMAPVPLSDSRPPAVDSTVQEALVSQETMSAIHANLRKWLDARRRGSEETESEAMQALEALLNGHNAAQIARLLNTEELETPFGLDAIRDWTNESPVEASNWMASRPGRTSDDTWAVAQGWMGDSDGLQHYAAQLPAGPWKQTLLEEAGAQMSASDPAGAIALARQMSAGGKRTGLLQSIATNWIASDPNAGVAWINRVEDPALREQLTASAAQSCALTDPAAAAAWLALSVKSDAVTKDAVLNIAQTWVAQDPVAAASWVGQLSPGDTRTAAVSIISKYWQQTDPAAAMAWVKDLSSANQ